MSLFQRGVGNTPRTLCVGYGDLSWDIKVEPQIAWNVGWGASGPLRAMKAYQMFWHAEGIKTYYSGSIAYNGQTYTVSPETCNGYTDKNWGSDFTTPWVWLSTWDLTSRMSGKKLENSVFEIGGGTPKIGPITLKGKLLGCFYYEGTEYEFNFLNSGPEARHSINMVSPMRRSSGTSIRKPVKHGLYRIFVVPRKICFRSSMKHLTDGYSTIAYGTGAMPTGP